MARDEPAASGAPANLEGVDWVRLLFNAKYYMKQSYCAEERALEDFRTSGYYRFVDPHPLFDVRYFIKSQHLADVSADPFDTIVAIATRTGRCPVTTPFFNTDYYAASNPDVVRAGVDPFLHYLEHGAREGRRANPWYDLKPFEGDSETFFGAADGLDSWIEQADSAKIVTADWIAGFGLLSPAGSHAAFWRARAEGARMCPFNLEWVFGPVEQATGENAALLRETLHVLTPAKTTG